MGHGSTRHAEYAGDVCVTVKAHATVEQLEVGLRHGCVENVFVDVDARTRMDEQDVVSKMALRQSPQPLQPLRSNHFNCQANHGHGSAVEPSKHLGAGPGPIRMADRG